jgi:protein MpaA
MPELIQKINTKQNNEGRLFCAEPHYFEKTLLIIGVMHGDEWQGEPLVERLMLDEPTTNKILYIPCLNPDGKAKNTRQNANRVDLNRNFPLKTGEFLESALLGRMVGSKRNRNKIFDGHKDKHKPDAVLTLHNPYRIVNL